MATRHCTPYGWPEPGQPYLAPTGYLDYEHPVVAAFADQSVAGATDARERAVWPFYAVGDRIRDLL